MSLGGDEPSEPQGYVDDGSKWQNAAPIATGSQSWQKHYEEGILKVRLECRATLSATKQVSSGST
jgi:hypothetical protein